MILSCKKAYQPPSVNAPASYLVVEGIINSGSDSTIIKLSKTVNLSSKVTTNPVLNATLTVEGSNGNSYPLVEAGMGKYVSAGLNLAGNLNYRLRIKTADDKEYVSDFVPVVKSPPIDTVSYTFQNNGIQVFVSTHDPQNSTRYYRWDYQETWVIHSTYYSFYKSTGDTVIERNLPAEQVYQCWQSDTSSTIVLGSSFGLTQDIINGQPVAFVESTSPKVDGSQSIIIGQASQSTNAYSILVRQYALSSDAYNFWSKLKKNTEQLGGIFDAQPTELTGNIHSLTNPSEPVLGYISAGTTTTKRIFIANGQIPVSWLPNAAYNTCKLDTLYLSIQPQGSAIVINQENEYFNYNRDAKYNVIQIPIAVIINPINDVVIGHTGSSPACVDCTLRGTNKQPVFWK